MEKKFASNIKISHALLALIFLILFIFTAIANPLIAHAVPPVDPVAEDRIGGINQLPNISSRDANVDDVSTDQQAGYLYYAASGTRCGVMWYVLSNSGTVQASGMLLDSSGQAEYGNYKSHYSSSFLDARYGYGSFNFLSNAKYEDNVSTVYYSGGWKAKGIDVLAYLMEDVQDEVGIQLKIKDIVQPTFPR